MKLFCKIEPFDRYQAVYLADDDLTEFKRTIETKTIEELIEYLPDYCYKNNIKSIVISSDTISYVEGALIKPLKEKYITDFKENIEIEVI